MLLSHYATFLITCCSQDSRTMFGLYCICDPTRENQLNYPKAFLSIGSFEEKKGNSKSPEPNFLKFCDIVRECKCQLFMRSVNFSCAKKSIKSSSEDGGNFINKNRCVQKIS